MQARRVGDQIHEPRVHVQRGGRGTLFGRAPLLCAGKDDAGRRRHVGQWEGELEEAVPGYLAAAVDVVDERSTGGPVLKVGFCGADLIEREGV